MSGMNGIPILTLLTALPVLGAIISVWSGKHARGVAMITTLISLGLSLMIWMRIPADGSIGLLERAA